MMKKRLFPMLALIVLASCSQNESVTGTDDPLSPTPIRLGAGVAASTKAPIVSGSELTAGIAGWEKNGTVSYSVAPTWHTTISTTAHPTTAATVTWGTQQYYNADASITTYMKAWYPEGTLNGTTVSFTNDNGSVDALLAPAFSGVKTDTGNKTVAFAHKTTQLKFKIKAGTGLAANTKIKKITLNNIQLPTGFNLATDAVTWCTAADFDISGIAADGVAIPATAATVGNPIMFKAWADNTLTIDVETSTATFTGKAFTTTDTKLTEGKAYEVTLTFTQAGIGLNATVADWVGDTGSGEIK